MRGRKPKPTKLKILQGNPGRRRLNTREPAVDELQSDCPDFLGTQSRKEWDRIKAVFLEHKILTESDRSALIAYCSAWGRWIEAEEQIKKSGMLIKAPSGYPIHNPWLAISNKAFDQMMKLMVEFGLTPSSRSKIQTVGPEEKSGVEEFLGNGT